MTVAVNSVHILSEFRSGTQSYVSNKTMAESEQSAFYRVSKCRSRYHFTDKDTLNKMEISIQKSAHM